MKFTKHLKNVFCGLVLSIFLASPAWATIITIDPVDYLGQWIIQGQTGINKGKQAVDLAAPGNYTLDIGNSRTQFQVDASGNTSTTFTDTYTASGNTITFLNTPVIFDPVGYAGLYDLEASNSFTGLSGLQTVTLVPGLFVTLDIGNSRTQFQVDASGNTSTTFTDTYTASGNTITFLNETIEIDPGAFAGFYDLESANQRINLTGLQTLELVPGLSITLDSGGGRGNFGILASPCSINPPGGITVGGTFFGISCVVSNNPPVADAGPEQIVEQQGPTGSSVVLNGSASSDPDDDSLSFNWTGPFGTATGEFPNVTIPAGIHIITLVVNDGIVDSDPDSVQILVQDTTSPAFTFNQLVSKLWPPNKKMVLSATLSDVSDAVTVNPVVNISITSNQGSSADWNITQSGGTWNTELRADRLGNDTERVYDISVSVTDDAGNVGTTTATVKVPHDQGQNKGGGKKK
ncbi:MAG: hypothetical protein HOI59_00395 [Nitrospina sp.]|nr:hypothetical protein [Nitrospina sp.]MBT3856918.1 hypothetical protein [Nitrospina sp.]MBT4103894.1 hypothetical protein [Nitrospina sp.]MBT4622045.1 hypothetical protein [Nitrospina sp.]MBT4898981.1 hypothetical protein [Nitrospina sp.]